MVVESLISSQGCPVEVCSNGAAALATLTQARYAQDPFHVVRVRLAAFTVTCVRISESRARSHRALVLSCSCARPDAPGLGPRRHDRIRGRGEAAWRISLAAGPAHHHGIRTHARRADDGHSRRLRVRKLLHAAPGAPNSKPGLRVYSSCRPSLMTQDRRLLGKARLCQAAAGIAPRVYSGDVRISSGCHHICRKQLNGVSARYVVPRQRRSRSWRLYTITLVTFYHVPCVPSRRQRSALSAHQYYELLSLRHRFRYRNTPQLPWKTHDKKLLTQKL